MTLLTLLQQLSEKDLRVAIREAVKARVDGDAALQVLAPGLSATYRPTRRPVALPALTFYDMGQSRDDVVPFFERTLYVDIWTADLDQAEAIAHRLAALLEQQPLPLPGEEGLVAYMALSSDRDLAQDDADLVRKSLTYQLLVYEYNGPPPFGG